MKNVVINKIARFVFTEAQLKAYWKSLGEDFEFESLTHDQLMKLASKMFGESSHSQLEQNVIGRGWRTPDDIEGKMVAEDDSESDRHIEVIDTNEEGPASQILIDRVLRVQCKACQFGFYVDEINMDLGKIKCPVCQGEVEAVKKKRIIKRK